MKKKNGFSKTNENQERGWLCHEKVIKSLVGTRVEIEDEKYDFNEDIKSLFQ